MTTTASRDRIRGAIVETFASLNAEREPDEQIEVTDDTPIQAGDSQLDSVEFVAFVTELEQRLLELTGVDVGLMADAREGADNPLRGVGPLTDHLVARLAA